MYPSHAGVPFLVQQSVSGTGQFNGTEYGRARLSVPNVDANAVVRVAAKQFGVRANDYTVALADLGSGNAVAVTRVEQTGAAFRVVLRRGSTGSPLATSHEVAAALNHTEALCAVAGGNGTGVCSAVAATNLAGGVDAVGVQATEWSSGTTYPLGATVTRYGARYRSLQASNVSHAPEASSSWWEAVAVDMPGTFRWVVPANSNGGLFHFEHPAPILIRGFESTFTVPSGSHTVQVKRVPLNTALEAVSAEAITVFEDSGLTTARHETGYTDVREMLLPGWALQVVTDVAMPGVCRFDIRREDFPYL